jgi:large subunit ribosomal protein L10
MSKFVKDLVTRQLKRELDGVEDLLLVNVVGLSANSTMALRKALRQKNIKLMVVKNSLARRATEGTQLAPAFEGSQGTLAMVWGSSDIVSLAKEVVRLAGEKEYEAFRARGGVMGGAQLKPEEVAQVSKWPTREEQLSILLGQILSPGAKLASQLTSVGSALASQIAQLAEGGEETAEPEAGAATAEAGGGPAGDAAPPEAGDAPPAAAT